MAETYMLKEKAGKHNDKITGITYEPGDTVESDLPLDKLFRSKFVNVKDVSKAKVGKKHVTLDKQEKARLALVESKKPAARRPTKEQVAPVKHERSPATSNGLEPEPGSDAEFAEEATRELQGKTVKPNRSTGAGMKPKAKPEVEPEPEDEDLDDEENEIEVEETDEEEEGAATPKKQATFGEDVTDEYEGTEDAGLKVFKNEAGLFTVTTAGKTNKPLNTEELKSKTAVKKFIKDQSR